MFTYHDPVDKRRRFNVYTTSATSYSRLTKRLNDVVQLLEQQQHFFLSAQYNSVFIC